MQEISKQQGPRDVQGVTGSIIVKEGLKANEEESSKVGQPVKRNKRVIGSYNLDMPARRSSRLYHYILLNDGMDWTPMVKINSNHTFGKLKITK